jgi:hypothetical protein
MAQGKSNLQEDRVLNWLKGTAFAAAPGTLYLGLYTTAPDDTGGGVEVSGNAYARQAITFGAITNVANGPDSMASNADVLFPVATPGACGTIVAVGLFDAVSAGNLIMWATITNVTINASDQLKFPSGNVTATED